MRACGETGTHGLGCGSHLLVEGPGVADALGVAANAHEAIHAGVDNGATGRRSGGVPTTAVTTAVTTATVPAIATAIAAAWDWLTVQGEQRDVRAAGTGPDAVAAADLVDVARAVEVAVPVSDLQSRHVGAAPALAVVLSTAVGVSGLGAGGDAHLARARVVAVQLLLELAARVVLLVAAHVAVRALAVGAQRRRLLGHGGAGELDELLAPGRVVGVQGPLRRAEVRVRVPLRLGHGAEDRRCRALARREVGALAEVDLVDGVDDAAHAKRRLRYRDRQLHRARPAAVGQPQLQVPRRVLRDVAEREVHPRHVLDPVRAVGGLELEERRRRGAGRRLHNKSLLAAVGVDHDVDGEVARLGWVVRDRDCRLRVGSNDGREALESKGPDAGSVGRDERTVGAVLGVFDA